MSTVPQKRPSVPVQGRSRHPSVQDVSEDLLLAAQSCSDANERCALLNRVVELNTALAVGIARRYANRGVEFDDLTQVALLALTKATRRFDPSLGRPFAGYATPTIAGEIRRHFRDFGWRVKPPRAVQELAATVRSARAPLTQRLLREPSHLELAEHLAVDTAAITEAVLADRGFALHPLDSIDEHAAPPADGTHEQERVELAEVLRPAVAALSPMDRRLLLLRFHHELTQTQIGALLGLSQVNVSRRLAVVLTRLRDAIDVERW